MGVGLSSEDDTAIAMRAILYSFGGSEQDASGGLTLNSRQTVEAVKFVDRMLGIQDGQLHDVDIEAERAAVD